MDTILQMMRRAGKRMQKLGKRQKRNMQTCRDNMPTTPLQVTYGNGTKIKYTPVGVAGQFLICQAAELTPIAPNQIEHTGVTISMWEFPDPENRKLFKEYHEALSSKCVLIWEDGTPISSRDLLGEKIVPMPLEPSKPSKEIVDRRRQQPTKK